jgi:hypothetical protein
MLSSIPSSLAAFLPEYEVETLDLRTAAPLIIERALQFGNRIELHWLFTQYSRIQIIDWFKKYARERLPNPHRAFWQIILDSTE